MAIAGRVPVLYEDWTPDEAKEAVCGADGFMLRPGAEFDAFWLIKASRGEVLSVLPQPVVGNEKKDGTFYTMVAGGGGRWSPFQPDRVSLLLQADVVIKDMAYERFRQLMESDPKKANAWLQKVMGHWKTPAETRVKNAGAVFHGVRAAMLRYGDAEALASGVCYEDELDADMRYLGFTDCIYDLERGCPLDLAAGKAALVTQSTGMALGDLPPPLLSDMTAEQQAARDDMRALLYRPDVADDLMAYVRRMLAWSLRGKPAQQYTLLVDAAGVSGREGAGNAGKTTLLQACQYSLGDYGALIDLAAFQMQKTGSTSGELEPLARKRFVWSDEAGGQRLNADRWKRVTGGGRIKWRGLYQNFMERDIIASVFGASNAPLHLELTHDAEKRRYRPVPVPEIPEGARRIDLKDAWKVGEPNSAARRAAFLAELLCTLALMSGPPTPPQAVLDLADEHQAVGDGDMGVWVRAEVSCSADEHDRVLTKRAWQAFCAMTPEREKWTTQAQLTKMINRVHGVSSRVTRVDGKQGNGWVGLTLSADAERALADAGVGKQKGF